MTENHDLEALASNPHTDWDVLHWIAENHPQLRPTVAANPGTYQELVDALAALGHPEIDAAIAQREAAGGVTGPPGPQVDSADTPEVDLGPSSPMEGLWDTTGYTLAAQQAVAAADPDPEPEQQPAPAAKQESAPEPQPETQYAPESELEPAPAPVPQSPQQPEPASDAESEWPDDYQPAVASAAGRPSRHTTAASPATRPPTSRAALSPVAVVALALLGLGAIVGVLVLLFGGGEDEGLIAEPPTTATPAGEDDDAADDDATTEDEADEAAEEEAASEEDEAAEAEQEVIAEARTAVADLPQESSCEADADASVLAEFLAVADENWEDDDPEMLESTFESLQSACSTTHAASVFESARSGAQAPEEGSLRILNTVGTDWADREVGLRGAEQMSGFSAQDGNVECEFDDGVTCTVYQTSPALCDEGTTYTMTVQGVDVDCDAQLDRGGRETLSVDSSATDGFLVCTELSDRVTCYNSIDPFGFEMSNTGNYAY